MSQRLNSFFSLRYLAQTQNPAIDRSRLKLHKTSSNKRARVMAAPPPLSLDLPLKLSKSDLKNAHILGQVDKKYIIIKLVDTFIMIDQHAADERVKLEQMMSPSSLTPTMLEPSICIDLESPFEYHLVTGMRDYYKRWGIYFHEEETSHFFVSKVHPHRIRVTQLPTLILDRCLMNHALLKKLIQDYAYWIKEQNQEGSINVCPKGIMEILKSRACRSAIMFNDVLSLQECKEIVGNLSHCKFPFQCAHGRPSAIPIQPKTQQMHTPQRQINWNKPFLKR
ncbi:hypothetical protein INT47_007821 [Mucor saturninus]|uniref:MutL C-terminal dimerisation domain-containing protein n=1 Tax=Mucor saturninus TaxID=64648 RepID=A0A8H7REE7_9FUNG|nr:hypothetical protein INT47_007821 [Mucor saturninus]